MIYSSERFFKEVVILTSSRKSLRSSTFGCPMIPLFLEVIFVVKSINIDIHLLFIGKVYPQKPPFGFPMVSSPILLNQEMHLWLI